MALPGMSSGLPGITPGSPGSYQPSPYVSSIQPRRGDGYTGIPPNYGQNLSFQTAPTRVQTLGRADPIQPTTSLPPLAPLNSVMPIANVSQLITQPTAQPVAQPTYFYQAAPSPQQIMLIREKRELDIYRNGARVYEYYQTQGNQSDYIIELPNDLNLVDGSLSIRDDNGAPILYHMIESEGSDKVFKNGEVTVGRILERSDREVTILIKRSSTDFVRIVIPRYDAIELANAKQLIMIPGRTDARIRRLIISYPLPGLRWIAKANFLLDRKAIQMAGLVNNDSENEISGETKLIAGTVNQMTNQPFKVQSRGLAMAAMGTQASSYNDSNSTDDANTDGDLQIYKVGDQSFRPGMAELISIFNRDLEAEKIYVHIIGQEGTSMGYQFTANDFFPTSEVSVYDRNRFLGIATLKESRKGDQVELLIGQSTVVKCESVIARIQLTPAELLERLPATVIPDYYNDWKIYYDDFRYSAINRGTIPAAVIFRIELDRGSAIVASSCSLEKEPTRVKDIRKMVLPDGKVLYGSCGYVVVGKY